MKNSATGRPASSKRAQRAACHCSLLRKAARRISALYDRELSPTGLRITQYALLAEIGRSGPLSITKLADIMAMERNGLGHTLKVMERDKLVMLMDGEDRRSRQVSLSRSGSRCLAQARPYWQVAQRHVEKLGLMDGLASPLAAIVRDEV